MSIPQFIKEMQCPDCNKWDVTFAYEEGRMEIRELIEFCPHCLNPLENYNLKCRTREALNEKRPN